MAQEVRSMISCFQHANGQDTSPASISQELSGQCAGTSVRLDYSANHPSDWRGCYMNIKSGGHFQTKISSPIKEQAVFLYDAAAWQR